MRYIASIRDNVSLQHSPLFLAANMDDAKRQFASFLVDVPFSPTNFDLYLLGELEPDTLEITSVDLRHIINGAALPPDLTKDVKDE